MINLQIKLSCHFWPTNSKTKKWTKSILFWGSLYYINIQHIDWLYTTKVNWNCFKILVIHRVFLMFVTTLRINIYIICALNNTNRRKFNTNIHLKINFRLVYTNFNGGAGDQDKPFHSHRMWYKYAFSFQQCSHAEWIPTRGWVCRQKHWHVFDG